MPALLEWGVDIVRLAQSFASPALTLFMRLVTFLGSQWFYLIAMPFIYWCVDRRRGARLGILIFGSIFLNLWLKGVFLQPRPYDLDPSVGMVNETSPGLPSGHAQGTGVFWGVVAPLFTRSRGLFLALGIPLIVGISRIYLGVHFPSDVFAGWGLALVIVLSERYFWDRLARFFQRVNIRIRVASVAAVAFIMNALLMPDTSVAGAFFGAGIGFAFVSQFAPFDVKGTYGERLGRYVFGIAGAALLYLFPKYLFKAEGSEFEALVLFIRYALIGGWISLGAPWCFLKFKLANLDTESLG